MERFSMKFNNTNNRNNINFDPLPVINKLRYFNKDMNYYICSSGGCGSTLLFNYLSLSPLLSLLLSLFFPFSLSFI